MTGAAAYTKQEKARAHQLVADAVRKGTLVRQPCEWCGNPHTEGHHEDYGQPLKVMWLCANCHGLRHAELRGDGGFALRWRETLAKLSPEDRARISKPVRGTPDLEGIEAAVHANNVKHGRAA